MDFQNKGAGIYNVPIQLVAPDLVVQSLSPASVTLTIERIEQRSFPIETHYVGHAAAGVVVNQSADPAGVATVSAPPACSRRSRTFNVDVEMPAGPEDGSMQ